MLLHEIQEGPSLAYAFDLRLRLPTIKVKGVASCLRKMSSGFVSETELAAQRRMRQEEWERVRTADQPLARPEEPYDSRSLYERLLEQKSKKDAEYEEAHKLKNMIKGLDDDEVEFLDLVDRTKLEEERKKHLEEEKEMKDFKAAVASLQEKSLDERLKQELKRPRNAVKDITLERRSSQPKLLAGVVVRKPDSRKHSNEVSRGIKRKISAEGDTLTEETSAIAGGEKAAKDGKKHGPRGIGTLKCIASLPGLGSYSDTSDSDRNSNSDEETAESNVIERRIKTLNENAKS